MRVPDHYTGDGIVEKIRMVADVAGADEPRRMPRSARSRPISHALARCAPRIDAADARCCSCSRSSNGRPMVAGRNTAADGIIRLAGAVNAIDAYEGYKQITDEAVIAAGPDTVLVMQRAARPSRRRHGVRACGLRADAGGRAQILRRDGRALSARLRPAHRARRRAISPQRSIRRWRSATLPSETQRRRTAATDDAAATPARGSLRRAPCAALARCS